MPGQNAILLLAAANYEKQNYDMAQLFVMKGADAPSIANREPFYYYAGAITMAMGKPDEALAFFQKAIRAKSRNPAVYADAAQILNKKGRLQEAQEVSKKKEALQQLSRPYQFPYPERLKLEFY